MFATKLRHSLIALVAAAGMSMATASMALADTNTGSQTKGGHPTMSDIHFTSTVNTSSP